MKFKASDDWQTTASLAYPAPEKKKNPVKKSKKANLPPGNQAPLESINDESGK
jgi:hypothetical protein